MYSTGQHNTMQCVTLCDFTLHCIALHYVHYIHTVHHITSHHITYIALSFITFPYITYITNHFQVSIKNHQRSPTKKQPSWTSSMFQGISYQQFGVFVRLVSILCSKGLWCSTSQPNKESLETSPSLTHNCNDSPGNAHNVGSDWSKASIW